MNKKVILQRMLALLLSVVTVLSFCTTVFAENLEEACSATSPQEEALTSQAEERRSIENKVTLTISYYVQGTNTPIAAAYMAELRPGSEYSVLSPEVEGYRLVNEEQAIITGTLTEDVSVTVYYQYAAEMASYTVIYWGHEVDGNGEIQLGTYIGNGPIGSTVIAPDKSFDGYLREPADMNLVITADGQATKNLYYEKKINPSIVFNTDGSHVESITAAPGEDISAQIQAIQSPERGGYIFDGWDQELPTVMPEEDLVVHAVWKPGTSNYTVQYLFQNTLGDGYTCNKGMDEVRQATTDTIVTATDEDKQKGITLGTGVGAAFFGFDYKGCDDVQVTADGEAVLNLYFDREIWTVNLYDNQIGDEKTTKAMYDSFDKHLWKTFSGRYGAPYPSDFPTEVELNDHFTQITPADWVKYKYMGQIIGSETRWNGKNGLISGVTFTTGRSFVLEDVEGQHTVDIYPVYAKISYSLSTSKFIQSLNDPSQYDYYNGKVTPVTNPTGRYTIDPPKGFTILGGCYRTKAQGENWPGEDQNYGWQQVTEVEEDGSKTIQTNEVLEIRFQRVKNTVTFVSMDGTSYQTMKTIENVYYQTPLGEALSYVPESTDGRRFAGWYLSEDDFDKQPLGDDYTMPWTDVTLYAKWADPHCKVEFDSRGGSDISTQYVEKNEKAKQPEAPTKANYTFVGWFTAEGDRWAFDSEISGDITLYAVWKPTVSGGYTIQHVMQGTGELIAEFTGTGMIGDTIVARALNAQDAEYEKDAYLVPDSPTKSLALTEDGTNTVVFYYRLGGLRDYTVSYYLVGTETKLAPDKEVKDTTFSQVTEEAISIPDYAPNTGYQTVTLLENGENHIIFYYKESKTAILDTPTPAVVALQAHKLMDGKVPQGEQFTFLLKGDGGNLLQTTTAIDGTIIFEALTFDAEGEYRYTISEQPDSNTKVEYDRSVYEIIVDVNLNEASNTYIATLTVKKDGKVYTDSILFLNKTKVPVSYKSTDPEEPTKSVHNLSQSNAPKTGDNTNPVFWLILIAISIVGFVGVFRLSW